jgi:chromosome segregation ATPase
MDRRAERLVHDQLVETTCKESASQYFLITPKLLFGLKYHPMMRVLCVNNVSHLAFASYSDCTSEFRCKDEGRY